MDTVHINFEWQRDIRGLQRKGPLVYWPVRLATDGASRATGLFEVEIGKVVENSLLRIDRTFRE